MPDITKLCKALNMQRADLAKMIDVTPTTIWRYEHGKRKIPVEKAKRMAEILRVDWSDFYKEDTL